MSTHILAIESSTSVCGVALLSADGSRTHIHSQIHEGTGGHAERILPMVDDLLHTTGVQRHQLSAIAFGQGPGAFTGLRVACGVAQGLAFALGIPVIAVPSLLAVVAPHETQENQLEVVALDARMQELYVAAYRYDDAQQNWMCCYDSLLLDAALLPLWLQQVPAELGYTQLRLHGDVATHFPQVYEQLSAMPITLMPVGQPTVEAVAELAWRDFQQQRVMRPEDAMPVYVRDKVAFTTAEREQGLGGNPAATWQPQ